MKKTHKEKCSEMIAELQERKNPLDSKRAKLNKSLKALLAKYADQESKLRAQIKSLSPGIREIDLALSSVNASKDIKDPDISEVVLKKLNAKIKGLTNGNV